MDKFQRKPIEFANMFHAILMQYIISGYKVSVFCTHLLKEVVKKENQEY